MRDYKLFAHVLDRPVRGPSNTRGDHPSDDAIGGYYGCRWDAHFKDHRTGESFRVICADGTYGGYGPYHDQDAPVNGRLVRCLLDRIPLQVRAGQITLHPLELNLALRVHTALWIDKYPEVFEGIIGTFKGVNVVVDSTFTPMREIQKILNGEVFLKVE